MTRKLTTAAAVIALAGGLLLAQAPGPQAGQHGQNRQQRMQRMATFLDLTPDQQAKTKAIMADAKQAAQPIQEQLKQGHQALADAVKAGKSDADIERLSNSQGVLMGQMIAIHTKAFEKVYALLTPEQRQKADQLHERMKGMFQQHFGRGNR